LSRAPAWLIGSLGLAAAIAMHGCKDAASPPGAGAAAAPTPAAIETSLSAATQYIDAQELSSAQTILEKLLERAPREVRALEMLGQVRFLQAAESRRTGDEDLRAALLAAAYEPYSKAVQIEPRSAGLHHSAYLMAKAAGLADEAFSHVLEAARLDPGQPQYSLHAAQELLARHRLDDAEQSISQALSCSPDEPFAHATLAMIAMERGEASEAIDHIMRARSLDSASGPIRVAESRIRRWNRQPREALEALIGLDERARAQEAVAHEIASAYAMLSQPAKAAEAWELVCRRDARNWKAAVRAGEQRLAAGEVATASTWLEVARLIAPAEESVAQLEASLGRALGDSPIEPPPPGD